MESFEQNFAELLKGTEGRKLRWVVVFSPTGCEAMLRALGLLDPETGTVKPFGSGEEKVRKTFIATIGPTTRDYLKNTFNYEPDVCADRPSPEGVIDGMKKFLENKK
jgi:uroporphyrinogen-III synthase